jgi:hypothetical protein
MARPRADGYPERLRCFLHVPKSGGTSVYEALRAALPDVSLSVKTNDTSTFCYGFTAFEELTREARETLLVEEWELDALSRSDVVFGHFSLPTLLRFAPRESIATVLREPRTRLLSFYAWQRLTPGLFDMWQPYRPEVEALRPLDDYLSEPQIAPEVDNVVCRMLLYGDPQIPALDFIAPDDVESLASDAIAQLDQLGFVGVLERAQATWEGLSRFFDAPIEPARERVTASAGVAPDALPLLEPISDRTLDLLEARSAADALVYTHALMAHGSEAEARQICNSAFAAQLVRLGDIAGISAASAQSLARRIAETESRLAALAEELHQRQAELNAQQETVSRLQDELERHRVWLRGIQGSMSWRLTSPLRAAKRRMLGVKPS